MQRTINFLSFVLLIFIVMSCQSGQSAEADQAATGHEHHASTEPATESKKKPLSPRTSAMANVGEAHIHIDYSSPSVRGRTIWGGLVAFDQVWVTGAHQATSINFNKDVKIDGQTIEAGTYGFFTIPGKEEWTIILNKNYEQHLADDYDASLDVIRFQVKPEELSDPVEALTFEVTPLQDNQGRISVAWAQRKISFLVNVI